MGMVDPVISRFQTQIQPSKAKDGECIWRGTGLSPARAPPSQSRRSSVARPSRSLPPDTPGFQYREECSVQKEDPDATDLLTPNNIPYLHIYANACSISPCTRPYTCQMRMSIHKSAHVHAHAFKKRPYPPVSMHTSCTRPHARPHE